MEIVNHNTFLINPLTENAPEALQQAHLLAGAEIKYWVAAGTLLGLYRDGDFIDGDTDIDIEVQGYSGVDLDLIRIFSDMVLIRTIHSATKPMQVAFMFKDVIFDVYVFWRDDDMMVNHNDMGDMAIPYKFYNDLAILRTNYGDFPCPNPLDDYLAIRYGADWETPKNHKGLYTHAI